MTPTSAQDILPYKRLAAHFRRFSGQLQTASYSDCFIVYFLSASTTRNNT